MAGSQFLDKAGVSALWERMKQYVYECCCGQAVTYELKTDGDYIRLIGSDGSESAVPLPSGGGSSTPSASLGLTLSVDASVLHSTIALSINGGEISNAKLVLERGSTNKEVLNEWNYGTVAPGATTVTHDTALSCPEDGGTNIPVTATFYSGDTVLDTVVSFYAFVCMD